MNKSLRIAIADDEPDIRRFYERIVCSRGHEVIASVGSGRELVEQCSANPPDMIITDVLMPGMDGISATREITDRRPVPVIVISSRNAAELEGYGDCEHISIFLTKPVKTEELVAAVSETAGSDVSPRSSEM